MQNQGGDIWFQYLGGIPILKTFCLLYSILKNRTSSIVN